MSLKLRPAALVAALGLMLASVAAPAQVVP